MNNSTTAKLALALATGLSAVAYAVSPIDAVPDVIPVVGWLDDLGVLGLATAAVGGLVGWAFVGLERRGRVLEEKSTEKQPYEPLPVEVVKSL